MTKISNYELDETINGNDKITGTDGSTGQTKNFMLADMATFFNDQVAPGLQGPPGPQGPVGPAGLEWKGAWVSGSVYAIDDAVGYGGASYFCFVATSGTTAPDLDTSHWALLASQGAVGPQGPAGEPGSSATTITTSGYVVADSTASLAQLQYTHNTVQASGSNKKVMLPASAVMGDEVIVMADNNSVSFTVRVSDANPADISIIGVSSGTTSVTINPNENYRFIKLYGTAWKAEALGANLRQVLTVGASTVTGAETLSLSGSTVSSSSTSRTNVVNSFGVETNVTGVGHTSVKGEVIVLTNSDSSSSNIIHSSTMSLSVDGVGGVDLSAGTVSIKNASGKFTNIKGNSASANRTVNFQDGDGIVAYLSDVAAAASSGTWSPTITPVLNVGSTSYYSVAYQKTGNIVTATIGFSAAVTAASTATTLTISLPVNRSGSSPIQVGSGTLKRNNSTSEFIPVYVESAATSTVKVQFYPTQNVDYYIGSITFQYGINV